MELEQIKTLEDEVKLPLHEDIMQLAILGEIGPIQKLLDQGKYSVTYRDKEGITPLHVSSFLLLPYLADRWVFTSSGQLSIITTRYASIS